jgi:multicomponent Na+:H+ antiporter subunit E
MFLVNLLLALAWGALVGKMTPADFAFGFALGFLLLWLARRTSDDAAYFRYVRRLAGAVVYFAWQVVLANVRMAYYVLAPLNRMRPGIIAVPLDIKSDVEITMLANVITLTPGTLSLDASTDRRTLYVHAISVDDPAVFRAETKEGFERMVREVCEG